MLSCAQSSGRAEDPVLENFKTMTRGLADKHFTKFLLIILLVAGTAYASISYTRVKFARSEIAYAEISKEMLAKQSYVIPLYRNIPCIDKPAFNYWMIIPSFKIFGVNDFASRIPALLASIACLAIFALTMRKLWGSEVSLLSTVILATASRYWEFSTLCMTDMFLTLFDMVTLIVLYASLKQPGKRLLYYAIAAVTCGLAVLTKGPVGLILPAFAFFVYVIAMRDWKAFNVRDIAIGAVIFSAVALPWYLFAAATVSSGSSMGEWLWHHNVERFFGSAYSWHHDPLYMVGALFNGFAPWSALLPFAAISAVSNWVKKANAEESKAELYLWIWLVLTTTFFTLSHGKMNYYDLPAFPAAAGVVGLHLNRWIQEKNALAKTLAWIFAIFIVAGSFVSAALLPGVTNTQEFASFCMMPIGLLLLGGAIIVALRRKHYFAPFMLGGAAIALTLIAFALQVHPAIARQAPALDYIRIIKTRPNAKIALHKDFGTTVDWFDITLFHTDRVPEQLDNAEQMVKFLSQPDEAFVIVPENRFAELPEAFKRQVSVVANKPYMYEKSDLKFLYKHQGHLMGPVHLLLVSNKASI